MVFRLVNNYLDPKGIFLFDLNTVYKYETLLGENTIAENREEGSFIWENYYDPEAGAAARVQYQSVLSPVFF